MNKKYCTALTFQKDNWIIITFQKRYKQSESDNIVLKCLEINFILKTNYFLILLTFKII